MVSRGCNRVRESVSWRIDQGIAQLAVAALHGRSVPDRHEEALTRQLRRQRRGFIVQWKLFLIELNGLM
jgi:hypothetical protein